MRSVFVLLLCIAGCSAATVSLEAEFEQIMNQTFRSRVLRTDIDTISEELERMSDLLAKMNRPESGSDEDIPKYVHLLLDTCVKNKGDKCEERADVRRTLEDARQIEIMPYYAPLTNYRKACITHVTNKCAIGLSKCLENDIDGETQQRVEVIRESLEEAKRMDIQWRKFPDKVEANGAAIAMKKLAPEQIKALGKKFLGRFNKYKSLFQDSIIRTCHDALASRLSVYATLYDPSNGSDTLYKNPLVANRRVVARHCESILLKPDVVAKESWRKLKANGLKA